MLDKIIFRVVIAILILCVLVLGWCVSIIIIFNRDVATPNTISNYKQYYNAVDILRKELYENVCEFTNEEYREYIEKDMGLKFYIYKEIDLKDNYYGKAYPIIMTMFLDKDLEGYDYCETFVHEAIHLKQIVADETYVCYETFKYLYEDEVLHNVGVVYGWKQMNKSTPNEYNIQEQVVYYLTQK
jgi:hypothetical protein